MHILNFFRNNWNEEIQENEEKGWKSREQLEQRQKEDFKLFIMGSEKYNIYPENPAEEVLLNSHFNQINFNLAAV